MNMTDNQTTTNQTDQWTEFEGESAGDDVGCLLRFYRIDTDMEALINGFFDFIATTFSVAITSDDTYRVEYISAYDGETSSSGATLRHAFASAIAWQLYLDSK